MYLRLKFLNLEVKRVFYMPLVV